MFDPLSDIFAAISLGGTHPLARSASYGVHSGPSRDGSCKRAFRPFEVSGVGVCYVRETSIRDIRSLKTMSAPAEIGPMSIIQPTSAIRARSSKVAGPLSAAV
jgi:hypothetical protein